MDTMDESDADEEVDIPVLPAKRKMKVSDADLETVVRFVKKNRPNVLSIGEKYDILLLQAKLRHEHEQMQKKLSVGCKRQKCEARNRVAAYLNWQRELCGKIWSDFWNGVELKEAPARGNYDQKFARVPCACIVISLIQKFVRERRITRTRMVSKDVMLFWQRKDSLK